VRAQRLRRRVWIALAALAAVLGGGTLGYTVIGLSPLDALYQTVTTVSTVGFRELFPMRTSAKVFTILLILGGVGTVLYSFGVVLEAVIEGDLLDLWGRRRMERKIEDLRDHVVVCGFGRIGKAVAANLASAGQEFVVVDADPEKLAGADCLTLVGDATDDDVLRRAGIERARALVAATSTDTTNVYLALSGRALRPELFIVGRARTVDSEPKILRAGADRVINPQAIGGARIAALIMQPHVAEFLDVVSHEGGLEYRLAEVPVCNGGALAGRSLREARIRERSGALVLALRRPGGEFTTNPRPDIEMCGGDVLIVIGTASQVEDLVQMAGPQAAPA
jgi:voltage-gated potassium channel